MKHIRIIYNPVAGRGNRKLMINELTMQLVDSGYKVSKLTTTKSKDAENDAYSHALAGDVDLFIAAGGDGTLSEVINGIIKSGNDVPVTIYSAGTMNDFGFFLNVPKNVDKFVEMVNSFETHRIDVGQIKDRYFINVVSSGALSEVAHSTSPDVKNVLGPLAYYMEGLKTLSITGLPSQYINISSGDFHFEGEYILFIISNSSSIGGFQHMAPEASIDDGFLDCVLIKKAPLHKLIEIFLKLSNGMHVNSEYVEYFKGKEIDFDTEQEIDADGELIGVAPVKVGILGRKLTFLYNKK